MTKDHINTYEAIDRDIQRSCINAENEIKMNIHTKYVWSPALDKAVKSM